MLTEPFSVGQLNSHISLEDLLDIYTEKTSSPDQYWYNCKFHCYSFFIHHYKGSASSVIQLYKVFARLNYGNYQKFLSYTLNVEGSK